MWDVEWFFICKNVPKRFFTLAVFVEQVGYWNTCTFFRIRFSVVPYYRPACWSLWSRLRANPVLVKILCTCLILFLFMTSSNFIFLWLALLLITWQFVKNSLSNIRMGLELIFMCGFSKIYDSRKLLLILKYMEERISCVAARLLRIGQSDTVFDLMLSMLPPLRQKSILFQLLSRSRLSFNHPHFW